MHFTSTSTIPLALALLLTSSSFLSVSATPDSVAIVEPSENNQAQFDYEAVTGPTMDVSKAPGFTTRRYKARGRALTHANNIAITNTAVGGRDLAHTDPNDIDIENPPVEERGMNTYDNLLADQLAQEMCPYPRLPNECKPK